MALSILNKSKSSLSVTNKNKPTSGTFGTDSTRTFADGGTFGQPGTSIAKNSKNSLSISNKSKS